MSASNYILVLLISVLIITQKLIFNNKSYETSRAKRFFYALKKLFVLDGAFDSGLQYPTLYTTFYTNFTQKWPYLIRLRFDKSQILPFS